MNETVNINLSALESELSPCSLAVFRAMYKNARDVINSEGPRESYEKPLSQLMSDSGITEIETVANSIREIVQRVIECKRGEFLIFQPFLKSVCIENGIIRYSLPREFEGYMKSAAGI